MWFREAPHSRILACVAMFVMYIFATASLGCRPGDSAVKTGHVKEKPAKVELLPHETDLAKITLTANAEQRLGITTQQIQQATVTRHRMLSGQVVIPSGRTIVVSSPLAGKIGRVGQESLPSPGSHVESDQSLLVVKPLLSAERDVPTPAEQVQIVGARANLMAARTVAAGDVQRSQAELNAAAINVDRAQKLFEDRAGPKRSVDDAEAQYNIAKSNLDAAEQREKQLTDLLRLLDNPQQEGEATDLPMTTPISGVLNRIAVREGQTIASGAMLFEVVNLDSVWIRVPVFVDQLPDIDSTKPVSLVRLSGKQLNVDIKAAPVVAPPTADATASTADLYYVVDNTKIHLRPGQRVGVDIPLLSEKETTTIPNAAILYDIYGNAWVYTKTCEHQYTRARVEVRYVEGPSAVLANGPQPGTEVVVDGAAELFGTEFGAGK